MNAEEIRKKPTPSNSNKIENSIDQENIGEFSGIVPKVFHHNESLRISYENESQALNARLRIGLNYNPLANWNIKLVPQALGVLLPSGHETTIFTNNTDSLSVQSDLRIHEGFGEFDTDKLRLRLGRQELHLAQGHLLGSDEWNPLGRSFDAVKLDYFSGLENIAFFYSIINSQSGGLPLNMPRHEFLGLTYTIQDAFSDQFDFYILNNSNQLFTSEVGNDPKISLLTVGTFSKKRWGPLSLSFDGVFQDDSTVNPQIKSESQIDVEAAYSLKDFSGLTVGIEYSRTSPEFNTLFQNSRSIIGLFDYFSPRNLQDLAFHILKKTEHKMNISLDFHSFNVIDNNTNHPIISPNGAEVFSGTPGENRLGEELDLSIGKKYSSFSINGGITFFNSGPYLSTQNHIDSTYHWITLTYNQ